MTQPSRYSEGSSYFKTQPDIADGNVKLKKIRISVPADDSEIDSAWDIPTKSVVLGVFLDVITAEATGGTKTLDVGLLSSESGGDADGFLAGASVAATGLVKGTLLNTGQTLGALLAVDEDGSATLVPEPHPCNGTAKSVSYTAGSDDFAELVADIIVAYIDLTY